MLFVCQQLFLLSDAQNLSESISDFHLNIGVLGRFRPQRDLVDFGAHVHPHAVHVRTLVTELITDESQQDIQPIGVEAAVVVLFVEAELPETAVQVLRVLPHGRHVFLEEHVITTHVYLTHQLQVIINSPEILDIVDGGNELDVLLPRLCLLALVEPKRPAILERILDVGVVDEVVMDLRDCLIVVVVACGRSSRRVGRVERAVGRRRRRRGR